YFNDKEALFRSIDELSKLCKKAGISEIVFHATEGTNLEKTLSEKFKKLPSWNIGYKALGTERSLENMNFNPGDLDTF
ncbi:MAG: hypothetical protein IAF38_03585, partial [Bacteroidia bacterium]|nr:hypothetical protein [Bacteroidia bacterium]